MGVATRSSRRRARAADEAQGEPALERTLPSGRTLHVGVVGGAESVEVRSPSGEVEVSIAFGKDGPVVTVRAARRLELASEDVAIRCRKLDVAASEGIRLASKGGVEVEGRRDVSVRTEGDVRLNGAFIRLNCTEE